MSITRLLSTTIAATVLILSAGSALADQPEGKKTLEIDFEDDMILGEIGVPDGVSARAKENETLTSLVSSRGDFTDQLLRAVESL